MAKRKQPGLARGIRRQEVGDKSQNWIWDVGFGIWRRGTIFVPIIGIWDMV